MSFAFDLDTEIKKLKGTLANPANLLTQHRRLAILARLAGGHPQTMILTS